jgi:hypothetical protein
MKTSFEKFMASNAVQSVELGAMKVELALIDDAKKGMDIVLKAYNNGVWNQLERLPNNVAEIVSNAKSVLMEASKGQALAIQSARKISEMAKELGIPNPKEIDDIFKNNDYDTLVEAFAKDIDRIINQAKSRA